MRVFVAVEISNMQVIKSISKVQKEFKIKAKPVEPQNLHFTLSFLGEISKETSQKIKVALRTIEFSSFQVYLKGIGVFPNIKSPRVLWIGTDDFGRNHMMKLATMVESILSPIGFKNDKKFLPHITIFRIKNKIEHISKDLKKYENYEFGSQTVSDIKLKQSILTPEGPLYSDLEEIKTKK